MVILTDSALEKSSKLYCQLAPLTQTEQHDSLSSQVECHLVSRTGLGSLSRLFMLLRVLLENALSEPIEELFLLRTKLPIIVSPERSEYKTTYWIASKTA